MKIKFLFGFIIILFLCTCSDEAAGPPSDIPYIEFPMYYGTYLYNDAECGGADIQYATLDEDEITFFDYLGDVLICPHDWGKKIILGNLKEENLLDIWFKEKSMKIRKKLSNSNRKFSPCNVCDVNGTLMGEANSKYYM
ncbi:MAG: hypothetical protein CMF78_00340 [Candidatus Marinimicrobia bacterium]|nr:hypothetical protein [Candidatus Neomarinimicrobiota bacterium]